jgi:hypothetical protein
MTTSFLSEKHLRQQMRVRLAQERLPVECRAAQRGDPSESPKGRPSRWTRAWGKEA